MTWGPNFLGTKKVRGPNEIGDHFSYSLTFGFSTCSLSSLHSQNFDLTLVLAGKVLQKVTNLTLSMIQTVISYQIILDVFNLSNEHIHNMFLFIIILIVE